MVEIVRAEGIPNHLYEEAIEAGRHALQCHIAESASNRPKSVTVGWDSASEEFVCVLDVPNPAIARYARITGYLSDTRNWHKAKAAELKDRTKHLRLLSV